jgi:hypothetical protein
MQSENVSTDVLRVTRMNIHTNGALAFASANPCRWRISDRPQGFFTAKAEVGSPGKRRTDYGILIGRFAQTASTFSGHFV